MKYFVYLIISKNKQKHLSYVGYTNNLKERLAKHNTSKGAKFTRGRKWILAYSMSYCLLYTSQSPRDVEEDRMPSSA